MSMPFAPADPVLAGGDSLVAHRGVVGPGTDVVAGIPGRPEASL